MLSIKHVYIISIIISSIILITCSSVDYEKQEELVFVVDIEEITQRDTLIAAVSANITDYYIYKGKALGFQLKMLENFANNLNVNLQIVVKDSYNEAVEALLNYECDIIAMLTIPTIEKKQVLSFTEPIAQSRQVLIQKLPDEYYKLSRRQLEDSLIRSQLDLAGKSVYINSNPAFKKRLQNLSQEIAADINIIEVDTLSSYQIIEYISKGKFDFSVATENKAMIKRRLFNNIDVKTPVSFYQNLVWTTRKDSPLLLNRTDEWLIEFKKTRKYINLYNQYFLQIGRIAHLRNYYSSNSNKLSIYDDIIQQQSRIIEWDWLLVASLIFQESRFNPEAISSAGAFGIMQLMPPTAEELGVDSISPVEEHINAGVRYLGFLDNLFNSTVTNPVTRTKLILASYNIGFGHVQDAIRLAEYNGKDPNSWKDMEYYLVNLSNPEYYKNEVVRSGRFAGIHGVIFANEIYERYLHYRNLINDD